MIEQCLGVEDRVLAFAEETRLGYAAEDQRCRHIGARWLEVVAGEVDRSVSHAAPLQRREQGLKPLRVLVEDGKLRFGTADAHVRRGLRDRPGWSAAWSLAGASPGRPSA